MALGKKIDPTLRERVSTRESSGRKKTNQRYRSVGTRLKTEGEESEEATGEGTWNSDKLSNSHRGGTFGSTQRKLHYVHVRIGDLVIRVHRLWREWVLEATETPRPAKGGGGGTHRKTT